jgi:3-isopropylmalate/(R)-2-methylmalate dehydratase small subunit
MLTGRGSAAWSTPRLPARHVTSAEAPRIAARIARSYLTAYNDGVSAPTSPITRIVRLEGTVVPVAGQDIDTDRIMPARFLKAISFEGLERHVFEDDRIAATRQGGVHPFDDARFAGASILAVNRNFGCGSSREHAPQGLRRWGVTAVVGESFSEIFFGNSLAIGMPCLAVDPADAEWLLADAAQDPTAPTTVDVQALTVTRKGRTIRARLPKSVQEAFLSGDWDATGQLLSAGAETEAVAASLPYVRGF